MLKDVRIPRYALINGREVSLIEVVPHAISEDAVCIFKDGDNHRRFVDLQTWRKGARDYIDFAEERHLITSESSGREKLDLFKSLFRGREDVHAHGH